MNRQNLPAQIGSRMNALGYTAEFIDASSEAWKKQSPSGYVTISAHDTGAAPLFPNNALHADTSAKVWSVRDCNSGHAPGHEQNGLTLDEAIARGAAYESAQRGSHLSQGRTVEPNRPSNLNMPHGTSPTITGVVPPS